MLIILQLCEQSDMPILHIKIGWQVYIRQNLKDKREWCSRWSGDYYDEEEMN